MEYTAAQYEAIQAFKDFPEMASYESAAQYAVAARNAKEGVRTVPGSDEERYA